MDKSKLYLRMCDCTEVQENKWAFEEGDWFAYYEPKAHGMRGDLRICNLGSFYYAFTREDVQKDERLSIVGYDEGDCELVWKGTVEWLPTQAQIQGLMPHCSCYICLEIKMHNFVEDNIEGFYEVHIDTMEKVWLCLYMYEIHKKRWDGKEWVKL